MSAGSDTEQDSGPARASQQLAARNEVLLVGRVSGLPEQRELPSGDQIVAWRVVVDRKPVRRPPEGVRTVSVDTFDCVAWTARLRRSALVLAEGDIVEVQAALRRRFWRAGGATASRYELEVLALRRLSRRAGRPESQ